MKIPVKKSKKEKFNFPIWYAVIATLLLMFLHTFTFGPSAATNISYSEFKVLLREGKVETCQIKSSLIRGTLRDEGDLQKKTSFVTAKVDDPDLVKELEAHGIM